jgi:hypothetical protein
MNLLHLKSQEKYLKILDGENNKLIMDYLSSFDKNYLIYVMILQFTLDGVVNKNLKNNIVYFSFAYILPSFERFEKEFPKFKNLSQFI